MCPPAPTGGSGPRSMRSTASAADASNTAARGLPVVPEVKQIAYGARSTPRSARGTLFPPASSGAVTRASSGGVTPDFSGAVTPASSGGVGPSRPRPSALNTATALRRGRPSTRSSSASTRAGSTRSVSSARCVAGSTGEIPAMVAPSRFTAVAATSQRGPECIGSATVSPLRTPSAASGARRLVAARSTSAHVVVVVAVHTAGLSPWETAAVATASDRGPPPGATSGGGGFIRTEGSEVRRVCSCSRRFGASPVRVVSVGIVPTATIR